MLRLEQREVRGEPALVGLEVGAVERVGDEQLGHCRRGRALAEPQRHVPIGKMVEARVETRERANELEAAALERASYLWGV